MAEVPVKVFVRIRPLLEHEWLQSNEECIHIVSHDQLVLGRERSFRFDRIFPHCTSQEAVYQHSVSPLVSSFMDGFNSTVLAYGQTGSGKSYTMGSECILRGYGEQDKIGLIPKSLEAIFSLIADKSSSLNVQFTLWVCYIEIYKEALRDLLEGSSMASGGGGAGLQIREDEEGNTMVIGCTEHQVYSAEEALSLLEVGNAARITGATQMNQRSSRSHAIFTVHMEQRSKVLESTSDNRECPDGSSQGDNPVVNKDGEDGLNASPSVEQCVCAKFHFVDLAGSERANKTGNKGERFKESVHINSGLLSLGNVISALGDSKRKSTHVPYRDSKITRLLKDSLGGNARTVMITCLSPAAKNFAENLNSLKYAKRARNIRNRPVVNRDPHASRLQEMADEILALKEELQKTQLSSKPTTAGTTITAGSSLITMELPEIESQLRELQDELKLSRQRCQQYHTSISAIRECIIQLTNEREGGGVTLDTDMMQRLKEWLEQFKLLEGSEVWSSEAVHSRPSSSLFSPISQRAMETVQLLRRQLEQCQIDLQTDEDLFSEKMEEINELQSSYNELVREKERIESMWLAAQENEGLLLSELHQVYQQVSIMASELSSKEEVIQQQRAWIKQQQQQQGKFVDILETEKKEVELADETLVPSEVGDIVAESVILSDSLVAEEQCIAVCESDTMPRLLKTPEVEEFEHIHHSVLRGRVKTETVEDFTKEAVQRSLKTLNECLAAVKLVQRDHTPQPDDTHHTLDISSGDTGEEVSTTPLGQTHTLFNTQQLQRLPLPLITTDQEGSDIAGSEGSLKKEPMGQQTGIVGLIPAKSHGLLSAPHTQRHGNIKGGASQFVDNEEEELDLLNESAMESRNQLANADEKLIQANDELKSLNFKIRLKEELIHELVKSNKIAKQLNETNLAKIQKLEQEAAVVQSELHRAQSALQQGTQSQQDKEGERMIEEHKKNLSSAKRKLAALQKKQRETERMVQFGARSERRVEELESGVERLRNQQDVLKRKLKKQTEKKTKLETDLQKYLHRIQTLQTQSEHQSKVLKIKTEEVAAAQRKLRLMSGSRPGSLNMSESRKLEAQRVWLDEEVEKMLKQRQAIQVLEKELSEREGIIEEKEAFMAERDTLEAKQLKTTQDAARDIVRLSLQIESIESAISSKQNETTTTASVGTVSTTAAQTRGREIAELSKERDDFVKRREELKRNKDQGNLLSQQEQRKLHELNEHIEILEAAIDFKNDSITSKHFSVNLVLQDSHHPPKELVKKFQNLTPEDSQSLLARYFQKVVDLRLIEERDKLAQREMEVQVSEQQEMVRRLERSMRQAQQEAERQHLAQQKNHEQQVRFLMQQLSKKELEAQSTIASAASSLERVQSLESKIKLLEKDLYYYKKTSRELKKKRQLSIGTSESGGLTDSPSQEEIRNDLKITEGRPLDSLDNPGIQAAAHVVQRTTELKPDGGGDGVRSDVIAEGNPLCSTSGLSVSKEVYGRVTTTSQVVRKQKRQLRQLSTSDVAERMAHKQLSQSDSSHHSHVAKSKLSHPSDRSKNSNS